MKANDQKQVQIEDLLKANGDLEDKIDVLRGKVGKRSDLTTLLKKTKESKEVQRLEEQLLAKNEQVAQLGAELTIAKEDLALAIHYLRETCDELDGTDMPPRPPRHHSERQHGERQH